MFHSDTGEKLVRISLCMIVRDEAEMLAECLESVRGVVDEIVIVDTGSIDNTVELARTFGARVVSEPWRNDFAAARNVALQHATGDYVLQLDADERLAAVSRDALRAAVERADFDLAMLTLHNVKTRDASEAEVIAGPGRVDEPIRLPRVFRRTPSTRYNGMIHETVGDWLHATGGRVVDLPVHLIHLGILPEVQALKNKVARNIELLQQHIAQEPTNTVPYGYLAITLVRLGRIAEAREVAERGWPHVGKTPKHMSCQRLAMARAAVAYNSGDPQGVVDTCRTLEKREALGPDLLHLKGKALEMLSLGKANNERQQLLKEALAAQNGAIRFDGKPVRERFINGATSHEALTRKGVLLVQLGRASEAAQVLSESNRLRPGDRETLLALAEAVIESGDAVNGLRMVEPLLTDAPDAWFLGATAAEKLGATEDAALFLSRARSLAPRGFLGAHRKLRLDAMPA